MSTKVFQIAVGNMQNFVYLLMDEESRQALAVDSGWETVPIVKVARAEEMSVRYAVASHGHFDHVETLNALAKELGGDVVAHENSHVEAAVRVKGGETLRLGSSAVKVLSTPGHTQDSICLYDGRNLFTGDTLFIGAWGRTDLQGGSARQLYSSLHDIILRLPPSTIIYPGHDYGDVPFRTLGEESRLNPALLARSVDEFLQLTQD